MSLEHLEGSAHLWLFLFLFKSLNGLIDILQCSRELRFVTDVDRYNLRTTLEVQSNMFLKGRGVYRFLPYYLAYRSQNLHLAGAPLPKVYQALIYIYFFSSQMLRWLFWQEYIFIITVLSILPTSLFVVNPINIINQKISSHFSRRPILGGIRF